MAIKTKQIFKNWVKEEHNLKLATNSYSKNDMITNILNLMKVFNGKFANDDKQYEFEERAGIIEYDGGLSREDAERKALDELTRYDKG
jgi:hypothetical protein